PDVDDDGDHGARLRLHRRRVPRRAPVERRASTMRRLFVLLITLALLSAAGAAQTRGKKKGGASATPPDAAAASGTEPLRSIAGELNGRTVSGEFNANGRDVPFTFTFTRADVIGDRVQMSGDFQVGGRASHKLRSELIGTMATADNPWPSARDEAPPEKPKEKRSEEHTSELQSQSKLVCRLLLEEKD